MQWQPIDTAPKDGSDIWAYWHNENGYFQGKIHFDEESRNWHDDYYPLSLSKPTHWMPLPQPPTE